VFGNKAEYLNPLKPIRAGFTAAAGVRALPDGANLALLDATPA